MKKETLAVFLIDGLRYEDDPTPTRILSTLGFRNVEASLFTGLPLAEHGQWTDYRFSSGGPFRFLRSVPLVQSVWDALPRKHRRYFGFLIFRCAALLGGNIPARSSLIPPRILASTEFTQPLAADHKNAYPGSDSLFDLLRQKGRTWLYLAPPRLGFFGASDLKVERRFYASLKKGVRDFYFIKLGDLDGICHRYGPESPEARLCLRRTWRRFYGMRAALQHAVSRLNWVCLSDHGFMTVDYTITPPQWLWRAFDEGRLRHFFIDSTILRLWLDRKEDSAYFETLCRGIPGLSLMSDDQTASLGLKRGSSVSGDFCCVAPPGAVIWPDFFSVSPPKGMHGYAPHPKLDSPISYHGLDQLPETVDHTEVGSWLKHHIDMRF